MGRSFKDKVVLITGASSGIGEAMALEFSAQGASVVLAARRKDRLDQLVGHITQQGGKALALACDVTQTNQLEEVIHTTINAFGRLDVVVANAGFSVAGNFEHLSVEDYQRQFETNFFGVIRTAKSALHALKHSRGSLVLIGSVNSYLSAPGASAYCASKFALRGLAEALTAELRPAGVAVTLICPGFVESEIRQINFKGELTDAKDPVPAWLVMPKAKAARQIVRAVASRRQEVVITGHGKFGAWIARHVPWIPRLAFRWYRWNPPVAKIKEGN